MSGLKLAWYGDDFTGASDTLATLAQAGLRAFLFLDVPSAKQLAAVGDLDALGIAGAARAMAPDAMRRALEPLARFLAVSGARVLHYKCCSTFDSAPHVGNIATAIETLHAPLANPFVPILGGQPSLGRHCLFGQLFAVSEAGGPAHRIDRHPTMQHHPVTPMDEADLRRHLRRQGLAPIGLIDWRAYGRPAAELDEMLDGLLATDATIRPILLDVGTEAHLGMIGRLLWERARAAPLLVVGASGVAQALIDHWQLNRRARDGRIAPARGPVFLLAGSMSPVNARQIAATGAYVKVPLDAMRLVQDDPAYVPEIETRIAELLRDGRHVLAHTAASTGTVAEVQSLLASACARLLRRVLERHPVSRVGIAGGDTSSHAVQALAPWGLIWLGQFGPGVALCRLRADDPAFDGLEIMLKGGQMGGTDLYDALIAGTP
ncbi:MAG TPA: four-carbon acid sugar kinase family protein [Aliidongia sp.]|uniref:four-carbon acid sugar kinase family protein n=1 Tax=Aliidongia sp. TaxID=1914230 RepID=UPI002DDCD3A5|nr:four-carbon acid sugar kinase family protein [Aliidongia sp.]HEV2677390.1 four-carbon acid sugar kinase family protein [Aliidongia sp.]